MPPLDDFIRRYFAYVHRKDLASERFLRLTPAEKKQLKDRAMAKDTEHVAKMAQRIVGRDVKLSTTFAFHPSNVMYRELFTLVTGIKLPDGYNDTRAAVDAYIGQDKLEALRREQEACKQREEQKRKDEHSARMNRLADKMDAGIGGEELLELARHLGVEVHPRTAGLLRSRVSTITANQAFLHGKGNAGLAFSVWKQVREKCVGTV